jgi:hypothetical protein
MLVLFVVAEVKTLYSKVLGKHSETKIVTIIQNSNAGTPPITTSLTSSSATNSTAVTNATVATVATGSKNKHMFLRQHNSDIE